MDHEKWQKDAEISHFLCMTDGRKTSLHEAKRNPLMEERKRVENCMENNKIRSKGFSFLVFAAFTA